MRVFFGVGAALFSLSACMDGAGTAGNQFVQITTEEQFVSTLAGRRITIDTGTAIYNADGTYSFETNAGDMIVGTWTWEGTEWCRDGVRPDGSILERECQVLQVSGNRTRSIAPGGRVIEGAFSG